VGRATAGMPTTWMIAGAAMCRGFCAIPNHPAAAIWAAQPSGYTVRDVNLPANVAAALGAGPTFGTTAVKGTPEARTDRPPLPNPSGRLHFVMSGC
jgi:hypothetical protein